MANEFLDINGLAHFKDKIDQAHTQELDTALAGKQDVISDLDTIRAGAAAGADAYQKPAGGIPSTDIASGVIPDVSGFYTKPSGGIPSTDLSSAVQTSLGKADTALQSHQDISGKADKVTGATNGNFAALDSNGNLTDSGHKHSDYLTSFTETDPIFSASAASGIASSDITAWNGKYTKPSGGIPASDLASGVIPDITGKQDTTNLVTSFQSTPDDTHYPSEKLLYNELLKKIPYSTDRVSNANNYTTNGYALTSANIPTANLPSVCTGSDRWGVIFWVEENEQYHAGTQMFFPIDGTYKGRIFYRAGTNGNWSSWELIPKASDFPSVPVTDVTVGGTSVVSGGVAVIPAIPTVEALTSNEIDTLWTNN